jgi:hypothetical protein
VAWYSSRIETETDETRLAWHRERLAHAMKENGEWRSLLEFDSMTVKPPKHDYFQEGDEMKPGDLVTSSLPGESPWAIVTEVLEDGRWMLGWCVIANRGAEGEGTKYL